MCERCDEDDRLIAKLREAPPLTLTDAEREAIIERIELLRESSLEAAYE